MTTWVDSVLETLGDPRVISLAALGVSVWSLVRTRRLTARQTRIAQLELDNRERAEAARGQADIKAEFSAERITLVNVGGAPATDVNIEFLESDPISVDERRRLLPISRLDPDQWATFIATTSSDCCPPFKVVLSWRDPDGSPRRKEAVVYGG